MKLDLSICIKILAIVILLLGVFKPDWGFGGYVTGGWPAHLLLAIAVYWSDPVVAELRKKKVAG